MGAAAASVPLVVALALSGAQAKWVALVHVSGDVPAGWQKDLLDAAQENKQSAAWAPPPAVTLDEAQLALGCAGWSKACAGQIASMTGAAVAFVVDVAAKDNGGATVSVQAVKANGAPMAAEEKLELPSRTDKDLEFAKDFVKNARGQRQGYLVVDSDTPNAEVSIDGERKGHVPWKDMVAAGEHRIMLTAEGKAPLTKTVTVKPGLVDNELLPMSAAGPPPSVTPTIGTGPDKVIDTAPPPVPPQPKSDTTVIGWSVAGVGGVMAGAAGVFAGAAIYDRFYNRVLCGDPPEACVPNEPMLFGIYKAGPDRDRFNADAPSLIGGSLAVVGVGAILTVTGVVLALPDDDEAAAPPADEAPAAAPSR